MHGEMHLVFKDGESVAKALAERARSERVAIEASAAGSRLLFDAASHIEGAVVVTVPEQLDRAPHLALSAAAQCSAAALRDVAAALANGDDAFLGVLERHVSDRPLVVEGIDRFVKHGTQDSELWQIVKPEAESLSAWLGERAALVTHDGTGLVRPPAFEVSAEHASIWSLVREDPELYTLALLREELDGAAAANEQSWDVASLIDDVWEGLSAPLRRILSVLAVHGRPLPTEWLDRLPGIRAGSVRAAIDKSLVTSRHGEIRLSLAWQRWCPVFDDQDDRLQMHSELGDVFASWVEERGADAADPRFVLEAHRHLSESGQVDRAARFARYGVVLLLNAGRQLSRRRAWGRAAHAYETVLGLESAHVGRLERAYATHYRHYNRYKGELEPIRETLGGYESSLGLWTSNALFWSRFVTGLFVDRQPETALEQLARAHESVDLYAATYRRLIGRTVERLLARGLVVEAAFAWGDSPQIPVLDDSLGLLEDAMAKGFDAQRIHGAPGLVLYDPLRMYVHRVAGEWAARGLHKTARNSSPRAALEAWANGVREEALRYLRAPTHTLSPEQRLRSRVILSAVDVIASRIGERSDATWVTGTLQRDGHDVFLLRPDGERHALPDHLHGELEEAAAYRVARVALGRDERPCGPVLALAPAGAAELEELLEEWKRSG